MSKFGHTDPKELPIEVDILFKGRRRVTRRFELGVNNSADDAIYKAYGAADPATITAATTGFEDLRLIQQKVQPSANPALPSVLIQMFETITDELSLEISDAIDYELNGLKRTTRQFVGSNIASFSAFVVGTQTFGTSPVQYLASVKIDKNEAFTRVNAVYLQAGVLSKRRSPGSIIGTIENTWVTWRVNPTDGAAMAAEGAGAALTGVAIAESTENVQGFNVLQVTVLTGTITGVKTTYGEPVEVLTPGTVTLDTITITAGGLTGTDAVIQAVPPRKKTVAATVTVEITTTPPTAAVPAYNLENISCSVTNTRASYSYKGSDVYTTLSGTNSIAVAKYGAAIGADISQFPGCYLVGSTTASGSFTYTAGSEASGLGTNTIVVTPLTATITNKLTGTGSTTASGYATTGILQRKARPVLTALNGATYWEVVTWSV